jgi:hypothetical protein
VGVEREAGDVGQLLGQQVLLERRRDPPLTVEQPCALDDQRGALARVTQQSGQVRRAVGADDRGRADDAALDA